jgi:hypothetical protein
MDMYRGTLALVLGLLCACFFASSASAASYEFDPQLSLTGDCSETFPDFVPDPDCPYPPPPGGPSSRFTGPRSVAVDAYGNEYVASYGNLGTDGRIDVFDDEGSFITEMPAPFGPKSIAVDRDGNLYAFEQAPGNETEIVRYTPTTYEPEVGKIEYDASSRTLVTTTADTSNGGVAVDLSNDRLYVSYARFYIEEYSSASAAEPNKLLSTITHEKLNSTQWVAVDGERRRLFASYCQNGIKDCGVLVFEADAPHALLEEIDGSTLPLGEFRSEKGWTSIAIDEETGHFFIEDLEMTDNIYEFDEDYEYVSTITAAAGGSALQIAISNTPLDPAANNHRYLFVPSTLSAGRVFAFKPPAESAPEVEALRATNIGEREAELRATIDPNGGITTYVFEYVSQQEFEESGFDDAQVAGEGTMASASEVTEVTAVLEGLLPGATYRFRVVAENGAGNGEEEGTFTTYSDAVAGACPNQTGKSALLPDCRAYELVTPPDTNGRPPKGVGFAGDRFPTVEVSPDGNTLSFLTEGGSLPGNEGSGAFDGDLYRSTRGSSGWATISGGPSGAESSIPLTGSTSPDQGFVFWQARGEGSAVLPGAIAAYVRYPDGHSELVGRGSLGTDSNAEGKLITEGGTHIIFRTQIVGADLPEQLEPDAPPTGTTAVYDRTRDPVTGEEETHVVSLLPGNETPAAGEHAAYLGASADGEGIAFEIADTLYLRVGNAVTYEIGEDVTFAGVSEGGERIFYVEGGDLFAFDTATEEAVRFSEVGNAKVVNVAADGSRAYFATTSVIPGGGQNPNGAFAKAGQQNLYLSEEGTISFVGTVTARDVEGEVSSIGTPVDGLGLWTAALVAGHPAKDPSRLTPDGAVMLFQSRANLDGYDPEGVPQIYRYDSVADRLHCVSCIPTKAPASGGASLETYAIEQLTSPPFSYFGFVPNLRPDGKRAFFESKEALVARDTNGVQDVYEWEEQGVGSCTRPGGCVYLISSGHSASDNFLYAISRTGDDVFFITDEVLVGGDDNTLSIYDARVGGGFPEVPKEDCVGEGCRPVLTPAPSLAVPAKPVQGQDNVPQRRKRVCPKGKRKVKRNGKVRCVKKKKQNKQKQRKAGTKRGAAR